MIKWDRVGVGLLTMAIPFVVVGFIFLCVYHPLIAIGLLAVCLFVSGYRDED